MHQKEVLVLALIVGFLWILLFKGFPQQKATDSSSSLSSCKCEANSLAFIPCQTNEGIQGVSIFRCVSGCNQFSEYSPYYNGHWETYRRCLTERQFINEGWSEKIRANLLYAPRD